MVGGRLGRFGADDPITLLGVVNVAETRGVNWQAADAEIGAFLREFTVPGGESPATEAGRGVICCRRRRSASDLGHDSLVIPLWRLPGSSCSHLARLSRW